MPTQDLSRKYAAVPVFYVKAGGHTAANTTGQRLLDKLMVRTSEAGKDWPEFHMMNGTAFARDWMDDEAMAASPYLAGCASASVRVLIVMPALSMAEIIFPTVSRVSIGTAYVPTPIQRFNLFEKDKA